MTTAKSETKPARRGLWLVVAVVVGLLALTTWDVLRNSNGDSPATLRRTAFDGDEAAVRRLIAAHPEWIDLSGSTNGQTAIFSSLYSKAAKAVGKTTPSSPASVNDPDKVFLQLEGAGATPLFHAVARKHVGTALALLEAGASGRARLLNGHPLVPVAAYVGDTNLMAALEKRGANLHEPLPLKGGMTAIHEAAYAQRPEMLLFLLSRGLSVNTTNRGGVTPLHIVAGYGRMDCIQALVTNGADLSLRNLRGETVLDIMRFRSMQTGNSNVMAVATWLEAFAATNPPPAKPAP
ncbi:MAG: ankyrin repeat protein [Limisphaerales bacterium]|nr:MAG: ankyrin repeat protein [Limisphaerales bacterium]KAG0508782.1 MAG: ankyrin repeat protein [Limisphaerales bacterium]TXT50527.1 MAG: ankyrin repeat protein [Limisphaerales bacterium]